jgi:hypothetical protein
MMPDGTTSVNLLREIVRCPLLLRQFRDDALRQCCAGLIECQAPLDERTHQVPEPWSGDISGCRILFFGSNPSIDRTEVFPALDASEWSDDAVEDFFVNRFGGGRRQWVNAKLRVLRLDGTHGPSKSWVRYWAGCRARASELLGKAARIGVDLAISEVVHCKSKGERSGRVAVTLDAAQTCANRHVKDIISVSSARVVVSMGDIAGDQIRRLFQIPQGVRIFGPASVANIERFFAFLDHPTGSGKRKKFANAINERELACLRNAVR